MRKSIVAITWVATLLTAQVGRATVWFDDALPAGAGASAAGGDSWNWVSSNPTPHSGTKAHQSSASAGLHSHSFNWAAPLAINSGDTISTYVYLDPANPPAEIMLAWVTTSGDWNHRAYWGANNITYGTDGTAGRRYMGALPAAGQWARLDVPASAVGLEGQSVQGMDFVLFNGRATWDYTGTALPGSSGSSGGGSTNSGSGSTPTNSASLGTNAPMFEHHAPDVPSVGSSMLRVITPTLLELHLVNTKPSGGSVTAWDFVNANGVASLPAATLFAVTANGSPVLVQSVGFKRRPLYAPLAQRDLRIDNCLYLQLASPIADNANVTVLNPGGVLWGSGVTFTAKAEPLRYSPAIHVNQEGYVPSFPKKAMVGYYLGSMGELTLPSTSFSIVNSDTGVPVWQGTMTQRADVGYTFNPLPYQKVYQADFSSFTTPGNYRLVVPGLGASMEFSIDDGAAMAFARAYQLGLYHQRCGTDNSMPHTRFTHDACHTAPVAVPTSASTHPFTWNTVANYAQQSNADNPVQTAPKLTSPSAQLYPFARTGTIDAAGGHHDAGDYSKYTINCAALTHGLMFSADSLAGVGALDNLGIPESGDGISDVLQEAKWEADYLAKIQDSDGGFYFLVYPQTRAYENNVTPDHGDAQVVWPKTTSVTAAAVAALAQCASSPLMKQKYPAAAALYLQKAQLGWQFLTNAIARHGKNGAYQKITHYGDDFADADELVWAACEMFLATGDQSIHQTFKSWMPDPTSTSTFRWGWWKMYACYGNAVRSYAFAARSGRLPASALDAAYLAKCETTITGCANDNLRWSQQCAYGSSFSEEAKRVRAAGWYFSASQAFDIAVGYQLNARADYLDAMVANMNYEGGCNPVNMTYVTGLGWKRQRDIVHGYALNDRHVMPPTGIPLASIQSGFIYLQPYGTELSALTYPSDDASNPYPFYDRWADTWNVTTEFVVTDQARGLGAMAFLAALTPTKNQAWTAPANAQIIGMPAQVTAGTPITTTLQIPGMDLTGARILWEAKDQQPAYGESYTFTPTSYGGQWVEAEAQWPDGRRVFAVAGAFAGNNLPTVSVTSADPDMTSGVSSDTATFTVSRTGATTEALTVSLQPSGSATKWNDYRRPQGDMPEEFTIPAGASSISVTVYAIAGSVSSGTKVATWTLRANENYNIASPNSSTLTLYANDGSAPQNVTANATSANASRVGPSPGTFTITRNGSTANATTISFTLGGTAVNGVDYDSVPTSVTIPAGASSATVAITPKTSANLVGEKTVTLTLSGGNTTLAAGPSGAATVKIAGNTVKGALGRIAGGMKISWPGINGKTYRIASRDSLTSGAWTDRGTVTATSATPSWNDTTTSGVNQRFYLVYVTN